MKLLSTFEAGRVQPGVLAGDRVIDLAAAHSARLAAAGQPDPLPAGTLSSLLRLLQGGPEALQAARAAADWPGAHAYSRPLASVKLAPVIPDPAKIICIGLNYADHCREQHVEPPPNPVLFAKFATCLIGPGDAIRWPEGASEQVDYEAELAVVIGQRAWNVPQADALSVIAGYTIANDISARDVQFADKQWVRGKSFDTFCPLGPYLVTPDEVGDAQTLGIRCRVNGQLMQDSNTLEMIFKVPELIAFITRTTTLLPGDVICTGTPHGVGVFRDPQIFLKPGDVVEVEIDRLGSLRNPVGPYLS